MNGSLLVVALILFGSEPDKAEKAALIPFAGEAYAAKYLHADEIEWIRKSVNKTQEPNIIDGPKQTIGYSNLAEHLVESHNCPRWVVEKYKPSPVLLWRIHKGYELQAEKDSYKDYPNTSRDVREYNASMRARLDKDFQLMKVVK